jgi:hypothetical protein
VKPVGAVRDDLGPGGQAELKHAPKIGIRSGFAKAMGTAPPAGSAGPGEAVPGSPGGKGCDPPPKLRRMGIVPA